MTAGKVQPQVMAGAKKVVFSTLAKEDSRIVVLGVNQETYDFSVQTRRKLATKAGNAAGLVRARDDSHTVVTGVNQETYDFSVTARLQPDTKAANAAGLVRGLVIGGFGKIMLKARPTPL